LARNYSIKSFVKYRDCSVIGYNASHKGDYVRREKGDTMKYVDYIERFHGKGCGDFRH
jgi:hypothetical protein